MLIQNGRIHDGAGGVKQQDLRITDGVIAELGEHLQPLEGEEIIDAEGMEVLPGFVQTISSWGVNGSMTEIRPSSQDNEEKSNPITPELDGFYAFNGRAVTTQQLGAFGITTVGVAPTDSNLFGGTIAAFTVDGVNPYKMCRKRGAGMLSSVSASVKKNYGMRQMAPMTRMWIFQNFAEQLRKAAEYKDPEEIAREAQAKDEGAKEDAPESAAPSMAPPAMPDEKLAALKKVITGEMPLFVVCDNPAAIQHVREITASYPDLRLVLVNGFGLTKEDDWLIGQNIPVVVRTASNPLDKDAMELDLDAIASLYQKGAQVVLSGSAANLFTAREDLLWNCAEMMKRLHDPEQVLPMVTSGPAKLLGIEEITGSLQEGKSADLVIWTANPLQSWQARIVRTFCRGREIYKEGDEMRCM